MIKSREDRRRAMDFAERLVQRRKKLGWNQPELVTRIKPLLPYGSKFDRAALSRYENGQIMPRPEMVESLARVLDIPPDQLLPPKPVVAAGVLKLALQGNGLSRLTLDLDLPEDVVMDIVEVLSKHRKAVCRKSEIAEKSFMTLKEFARRCRITPRNVERSLSDWRLTTVTLKGEMYLLQEEAVEFLAGPVREMVKKIWIPRANDGLSPLAFARKTVFLRMLYSLEAPKKK